MSTFFLKNCSLNPVASILEEKMLIFSILCKF